MKIVIGLYGQKCRILVFGVYPRTFSIILIHEFKPNHKDSSIHSNLYLLNYLIESEFETSHFPNTNLNKIKYGIKKPEINFALRGCHRDTGGRHL